MLVSQIKKFKFLSFTLQRSKITHQESEKFSYTGG